MPEICRLLLFTLLLYIFSLRSVEGDTVQPATTELPGSHGEEFINLQLTNYITSGCEGVDLSVVVDQSARLMSDPIGCSPGEKRIIVLLSNYFFRGCKASTTGVDDPDYYRPEYSTGEKDIIKLFLTYTSSGCEAAKAPGANALAAMHGQGYSSGERKIIGLLSSYFSSDSCKEPPKSARGDGGNGLSSKNNGTGAGSTAAGHHVQSVLELFLLICGVYFTRVQLLA